MTPRRAPNIEVIVIGGSAGALDALAQILPALPAVYPIPIALVLHVRPDRHSHLAEVLAHKCALCVREAEDKELLAANTLYLAPPDYHLLLERQHSFSLSVDELVNFSRPAIDVLFESAADAYGASTLGLLLTGANEDGARGLAHIKRAGGLTLVQSPETAAVPTMPQAAMRLLDVDHVLPLAEIGPFLARLRELGPTVTESE
jgi:two-component system, chemotaxis family, protein-glutamate methylesterase/glutaminase